MCEEEGNTSEHVPPKCLFPEAKDANGQDYRIDLMTVPSCDLHNGKKSQDDEFLMVCIAGIIGNNSIGYEHYNGKIQRALKRTSYRLLEKAFLKKDIFRLGDENYFLDILWGTPDYARLVDCFTHISYGVYYHHNQKRFIGEIKPYLGFLHINEKNPKAFKEFITHKMNDDLLGKPKYGKNQGVFYYQFTDPDEFDLFALKLCFYGNVNVYIAFMPNGIKPEPNLGFQLMNSGIKTIIKNGDKEYEFN
jgi:hypothetical protein